MYLGQVKISADIIIIGNDKEIKIGLIPIIKRPFAKIIREINKNDEVVFIRLEQLYPFPAKTLANLLKKYEKAIKKLTKLESDYLDYPKMPDALLTLAACQTEMKRSTEAKRTLKKLAKPPPKELGLEQRFVLFVMTLKEKRCG